MLITLSGRLVRSLHPVTHGATGFEHQELAGILGYKSRVTDLFNRHRKLNLNMTRRLHTHLNISYDTLVKAH